jgi:crotonobetainyl-CoA:carnitine CoA-transferase CaiB-like acyl-CoA transferase
LLDDAIETWSRALPSDELIARLQAHGVPAAAVRHPREAVRDPRVLARAETVPLEHPVHGATAEVYGMGLPITFSGASAGFDRPPPQPGEHNQLVYEELLGYSPAQLAELRSLGVI